MKEHVRPAVMQLLLWTVIAGAAYPLLTTGLAQVIFPSQANGSLIEQDGIVVGSSLIGQPFDDPGYFWSRPSVTGVQPYNGAGSQGSNLGPISEVLREQVDERVAALRVGGHGAGLVPVDLVTASGSGLDPHISPAAALFQVDRVAATRGLDATAVRALVEARIEPRFLGMLGEPVVNVLGLNLALDDLTAIGTANR